jgi:hypothetical protein
MLRGHKKKKNFNGRRATKEWGANFTLFYFLLILLTFYFTSDMGAELSYNSYAADTTRAAAAPRAEIRC